MVLMEYRFSSVGFYILAGDAISERRKPINSSSLYYKRFRPSNKRTNPLA